VLCPELEDLQSTVSNMFGADASTETSESQQYFLLYNGLLLLLLLVVVVVQILTAVV
jgi:uncharacterized integral membrane protein